MLISNSCTIQEDLSLELWECVQAVAVKGRDAEACEMLKWWDQAVHCVCYSNAMLVQHFHRHGRECLLSYTHVTVPPLHSHTHICHRHLMYIEVEAADLKKNIHGVLIVIPHTEVKKQQTVSPVTFCQRRLAMTLAAFCLHSAVCRRACVHILPASHRFRTQKRASSNFTHIKPAFLLWGWRVLVSRLCERSFKGFLLKWGCEGEKNQAA